MCYPRVMMPAQLAPRRAGKRSLASIGTVAPEAKKPRPSKKSRTVKFSSSVKMRRYEDTASTSSESSWMTKDEIERIRRRAKTLSKLHARTLSKDCSREGGAPSSTVGDAVRAERAGESLRGMEHVTVPSIGRRRRRVRNEAMRAAGAEQKEAGAYGSKAREALAYARSVAEEDATVAAAILAEDLQSETPPAYTRLIESAHKNPAVDPRVAALITSLFSGTWSRRQSLVSVQA